MLTWEEHVELSNMVKRGMSIAAIAKHLGKDRKTIRRYLHNPDLKPGERKAMGKLTDSYTGYLTARLEDNQHLAGTVLLRELRELGFDGSYETLARHLQQIRPQCQLCSGVAPVESVIMNHPPGSAQADWSPFFWTPWGGSAEIEVQLFGIELCRPKVVYGEFFERQSWAHLAAGHISSFDYFGGVPTQIRYDRTSQVFRPSSDEPTPQFADFAGYYGFSLVPCIAGRARSKGQIERVFSYAATSFFHTVQAATLPELNQRLRGWLDIEANRRVSADVPIPPLEALESERAHLIAVRRPSYPLEMAVERKVDRFCLVRFEGARYSVEPGSVGATVYVTTKPNSDRVEIKRGSKVIGTHQAVPSGEISFDPGHGKAIEALTLASLHRGSGRHRRKRNDAVIGARASEEAAIIKARLALGSDGEVERRDLASYDEVWR